MARKQTRRSVSLGETAYQRARLLAYGVDAPAGMHQTPAVARLARVRRVASAREVTRRVAQGMVRR